MREGLVLVFPSSTKPKLLKKWETNINACITIYSLINGNDRVIYGPVNEVFYRYPFLWMTWYGHQAVMCLHYTVVEEV